MLTLVLRLLLLCNILLNLCHCAFSFFILNSPYSCSLNRVNRLLKNKLLISRIGVSYLGNSVKLGQVGENNDDYFQTEIHDIGKGDCLPLNFRSSQLEQSHSKSVDTYEKGISSSGNLFDKVVESRYACTRFRRYREKEGLIGGEEECPQSSLGTPSLSNPDIVNEALHCLNVARRSPSGFNVQPYRLVMVHSPSDKASLARYCLGRNADRVRDSDCTILFLSDRECMRETRRFSAFLSRTASGRKKRKKSQNSTNKSAMENESSEKSIGATDAEITNKEIIHNQRRKHTLFLSKFLALTLLFSSGWPLPRLISNPISFIVRISVSAVSILTRRRVLVPSLSTADTWSSKNTMLVAMTYMLACTSRNIQTCPMEGFNVGGIRKVMGIPRRYGIPLIVSTGTAFHNASQITTDEKDDAGMAHGPSTLDGNTISVTERYPMDEVIFDGSRGFGVPMTYSKISQS